MPTRMLREGILDSERVNRLDDEEEVFYRRLMSIVDDYGRWEAQRAKLRARLYPLKLDAKSETRVVDLLLALVRERLVYIYPAEGKVWLQMLDFRQQTRSESKCPPPDDGQMKAFAQHLLSTTDRPKCLAYAQQLLTGVHLDVFVFGVVFGDGGGAGAADAAQPPPKAAPLKLERKPKDVSAVIASGAEIGLSESECRKFFHRYAAKGWKSGRAPLEDWRSELLVWQQRAAENDVDSARKNLSVPGGAAAFNPKQAHAHTGGLSLVN